MPLNLNGNSVTRCNSIFKVGDLTIPEVTEFVASGK